MYSSAYVLLAMMIIFSYCTTELANHVGDKWLKWINLNSWNKFGNKESYFKTSAKEWDVLEQNFINYICNLTNLLERLTETILSHYATFSIQKTF